MDVLYIIGKGRSLCDNKELRYSLRGLSENGKGIGRVFVAGYCPEWLSENVIKIPCEDIYKGETTQKQKHCNITNTILYAVDNSDIDDEFICSMDDHIYIRETDFDNYPIHIVQKPHGEGEDKIFLPTHPNGEPYNEYMVETGKILESIGLPTINYTLHRNMHLSRPFINEYRKTIENFIDECNMPEVFCLYGNAMKGKTPHEYKTVKDVLVHNGGEWWKTDSRNTEVFSVVDFKEGSGLDILLGGLFPNKCKYEK